MNGFSIFLRVLNAVLMIGVPCLAGYFLVRRGRGGIRPIGIGALGFILSQVGHIPFNQFLMLPGLERLGVDLAAGSGRPLLVLGISVGLSAGVFEEVTRYVLFRTWLKSDSGEFTPWKYGIGHGGIEAVFAGLLASLALVQVLVLAGEEAISIIPADQMEMVRSQIEAYWAVPWQHSLLGAWERVSALLFHLGASVFVYKSAREKNVAWLLAALLGHTALDAFAVIVVRRMDILLLEALVFVFALVWFGWAWIVRPRGSVEDGLAPPPPAQIRLGDPQITSEQIDESRYD